MANIKSSEKANRQRIRRTARNTAQKTAALANVTPPNARALQDSWDAIIGYRIALQAAALAALCAALALF